MYTHQQVSVTVTAGSTTCVYEVYDTVYEKQSITSYVYDVTQIMSWQRKKSLIGLTGSSGCRDKQQLVETISSRGRVEMKLHRVDNWLNSSDSKKCQHTHTSQSTQKFPHTCSA